MMCTDGRLVIVQVPPYLDAPGYWDAAWSGRFEESMNDWLDRIGGGEGCWDPDSKWVCIAPNIWKSSWFKDRWK